MVTVVADRYRLLDRLGTGGMSVVWRAHDEVLDREVAVKLLSPDVAANPGLVNRIRVEARAAARLRHPNVVEVHDFGETEDGLPYVVMELVEGRSLAAVLADGPLPWESAVHVCAQVAAALAAAHARGIVHRDVKPSNVMVTTDGVKLVDFGISATIGEADVIGGEVYGTPAYLAPERLAGGTVRPATDVYALGLLLYLTLAGRMPWRATTTTEMLKAHRYLQPETMPIVPGLPDEVDQLVRSCLDKKPDQRPSAAEAAGVLGATRAAPMLDVPTVAIPVRGHRRLLVAAAVVALLLLVGGIAWTGGRGDPRDVAATTAVPAAPAVACSVGYTVRSALNGKLSTAVTVTSTIPNWLLSFDLPDGQRLVRGWHSGWTQAGQAVQFRGSGRTVTTGFDASYAAATTLPATFRINDTACRTQLSVAGSTSAPTATPATLAAAPVRATIRTDNSGPGSGSSGKGSSGKGKKGKKGKG
jgi:serine/threonine-protein kinase